MKGYTIVMLTVLMSLVTFESLPTSMQLILALKLPTDIYTEIKDKKKNDLFIAKSIIDNSID